METIWISSRGDRTSYFSGASDYGYVNPSWDGIKRAVDEFCPRVAKRCVPAIQMEAQIEPHTVFSGTDVVQPRR